MKRITFIGIMAVMVVMMAAGAAMAGSLIFSPGYSSVSIKAGESATVGATLSIVGSDSGAVDIVDFIYDGSAAAWISPPGGIRLDPAGATSANVAFRITVPSGTAKGNYSTTIMPIALIEMGPPDMFDPMSPMGPVMPQMPPQVTPMMINIDVLSDKCSVAPGFSGLTADTTTIKVPNNKTYDVGVSGKVVNPEGCTLKSAWYTLTDEYGELGGTTKIQPAADGSFSASIPVKASRDGSDKDGRLYTITFGAENEAGASAGMSLGVTVSHDQGKK